MRGDRLGIGGIAREHLYSYRTAFRIGEQTADDLRVAATLIARVAEAGQRAMVPLKVSRGHIVEHQATIGKVTLGERLLDALLSREQPIHGLVQIICRSRGQLERLGQRTGGGFLIQAAGRGQLGTWIEDAGGNESADEIALGATSAREQVVQAEMTKSSEDGGDVAMGERAEDLDGLVAGDKIFTFQYAA